MFLELSACLKIVISVKISLRGCTKHLTPCDGLYPLIGCVLFQLAQIAVSDLRKCSNRSDKSVKRTLQITLLFGHTHTTHNAVESGRVYLNARSLCCRQNQIDLRDLIG